MKITKANITKVLSNAGVSKSVVTRGRCISGMTEGFSYVSDDSDVLILDYNKASSSYLAWDKFEPRYIERMNRMVDALTNAGYKVTKSQSGNYIYVYKVVA